MVKKKSKADFLAEIFLFSSILGVFLLLLGLDMLCWRFGSNPSEANYGNDTITPFSLLMWSIFTFVIYIIKYSKGAKFWEFAASNILLIIGAFCSTSILNSALWLVRKILQYLFKHFQGIFAFLFKALWIIFLIALPIILFLILKYLIWLKFVKTDVKEKRHKK
jgi:hypothetical protein